MENMKSTTDYSLSFYLAQSNISPVFITTGLSWRKEENIALEKKYNFEKYTRWARTYYLLYHIHHLFKYMNPTGQHQKNYDIMQDVSKENTQDTEHIISNLYQNKTSKVHPSIHLHSRM